MTEALNPKDIKFWTFLVQSIKIAATHVSGVPNPDVIVTGWFTFSTVEYKQLEGSGYEPAMYTDVLTPIGEPVTLKLNAAYFKGKPVDQICGKDVVDALSDIFKAPFNDVPTPPKDPKTSVAPSMRNKK